MTTANLLHGVPSPSKMGIDMHIKALSGILRLQSCYEQQMTWIDEALVEAKKTFASEEICLIPKTPSANRRKPLYSVQEEDDSDDSTIVPPKKKAKPRARKGKAKTKLDSSQDECLSSKSTDQQTSELDETNSSEAPRYKTRGKKQRRNSSKPPPAKTTKTSGGRQKKPAGGAEDVCDRDTENESKESPIPVNRNSKPSPVFCLAEAHVSPAHDTPVTCTDQISDVAMETSTSEPEKVQEANASQPSDTDQESANNNSSPSPTVVHLEYDVPDHHTDEPDSGQDVSNFHILKVKDKVSKFEELVNGSGDGHDVSGNMALNSPSRPLQNKNKTGTPVQQPAVKLTKPAVEAAKQAFQTLLGASPKLNQQQPKRRSSRHAKTRVSLSEQKSLEYHINNPDAQLKNKVNQMKAKLLKISEQNTSNKTPERNASNIRVGTPVRTTRSKMKQLLEKEKTDMRELKSNHLTGSKISGCPASSKPSNCVSSVSSFLHRTTPSKNTSGISGCPTSSRPSNCVTSVSSFLQRTTPSKNSAMMSGCPTAGKPSNCVSSVSSFLQRTTPSKNTGASAYSWFCSSNTAHGYVASFMLQSNASAKKTANEQIELKRQQLQLKEEQANIRRLKVQEQRQKEAEEKRRNREHRQQLVAQRRREQELREKEMKERELKEKELKKEKEKLNPRVKPFGKKQVEEKHRHGEMKSEMTRKREKVNRNTPEAVEEHEPELDSCNQKPERGQHETQIEEPKVVENPRQENHDPQSKKAQDRIRLLEAEQRQAELELKDKENIEPAGEMESQHKKDESKNVEQDHRKETTQQPVPTPSETNTQPANAVQTAEKQLNTTFSKDANASSSDTQSYDMTPVRKVYSKAGSDENYNIDDINSDDSTDDEEQPRKKIPHWAIGPELKAALISQYFTPPDLDEIFNSIDPPNLSEMFKKKKVRYYKRTSSAVWNSPVYLPSGKPVV